MTTELILGMLLIKVLVVDVTDTPGGLTVGIGTLGMDVSTKENVVLALALDTGWFWLKLPNSNCIIWGEDLAWFFHSN